MNLESAKQIIIDQQQEAQEIAHSVEIIDRENLIDFKKYIHVSSIKIVTGIRRSGKSTLILQALKNTQYLYLNFDDEFLSLFKATELDSLLNLALQLFPETKFIVFDEIQNILGWEMFVNKCHRKKMNLFITGSNSKLLSQELATHLTGRHILIELFPFSFAEFLKFQNININNLNKLSSKDKNIILNQFDLYFKIGSFPEVIKELKNEKYGELYLKDLYNSILTRDIVQRRKIKNIKALKELSYYMMGLYSSDFTYQSCKTQLGFKSVNTIKNYVESFEESYLNFILEPFSFKIKERISLPKKTYCIDLGMLSKIIFKTQEDFGKRLENLIFIELKRRQKQIFTLKDQQAEIDFITVESRTITEMIQVCWDLFRNKKTYEREINAFLKLRKKYPCSKFTIITYCEENNQVIEDLGIEVIIVPAWKWLLDRNISKIS